ncbi:hypothetical protein GCM10027269_35560 [Kribbella endophytica]
MGADLTSEYVWVRRPEPCVLELVSKLAREPWTDRPTCVHPVLGSVARAVHDHCGPRGRQALLPLAPLFLDTARAGFDLSARLVALCVSTALAAPGEVAGDERTRLLNAQETASYLLAGRSGAPPGGPARWWLPALDRLKLGEPFYRTVVATEHAAEAVVVAARGGDHDVRLKRLLRQCLSLAS